MNKLPRINAELTQKKRTSRGVGAPLKVQKEQNVLNIRRDTIVKNLLSNLQRQKMLDTQFLKGNVDFFRKKSNSAEKTIKKPSKSTKCNGKQLSVA